MKIRYGFVSNSSTSSYIILTTKENHERALSQLNEHDRLIFSVISKLAGFEHSRLFGREIISLNYSTGNYSTIGDIPFEEAAKKFGVELPANLDLEYAEDEKFDVLSTYMELVKKDTTNCYYWHDYY